MVIDLFGDKKYLIGNDMLGKLFESSSAATRSFCTPTIIHEIFETNCSFHVKVHFTGKV